MEILKSDCWIIVIFLKALNNGVLKVVSKDKIKVTKGNNKRGTNAPSDIKS